jgi:hypothetical protein
MAFLTWLTSSTNSLDNFFRMHDLGAGRTAGGYLDRHLGIRRHTMAVLLLPAAVVFFAVLATPNLSRFVIALAAACAVFMVLAKIMAIHSKQKKPLRSDLAAVVTTVMLVVVPISIRGGRQYSDI